MRMQKGPYLQHPGCDGVTVMWQTDVESDGEVRVYELLCPHVPTANLPIRRETGRFCAGRGTMHKVRIEGLESGCDYCYEVISVNGDDVLASPKYPFRTAPDAESAISFLLTAECCGAEEPKPNTNPYTGPLNELMKQEHADFIQSVGDSVGNGQVDVLWDWQMFWPQAELLHTTPYYPCVGNHEVQNGSTGDGKSDACYALFDRYFDFPHYYSYDYGCAHICVLDAPAMLKNIGRDAAAQDQSVPELIDGFADSEQMRFLEEDLAASDARWKFVVLHYPPYTSSIYDVRELREVLCPVLERHHVDVMFNSHAILYERTHPIRNGRIDPDGVRYVVVGGYGCAESWLRPKLSRVSAKVAGSRPNYVRIALTPYRLEMTAIDYEGKLFDIMTIDKS